MPDSTRHGIWWLPRGVRAWRDTSSATSLLTAVFAVIGIVIFVRLHSSLTGQGTADGISLYYAVLLPFMALSVGCFGISLVALILTSRQERLIRLDRDRIEHTEEMADFLADLDDEHMQSISSWLHDSIGHGLVIARMGVERLSNSGAAAGILEHLDKMLAEVRGMAASLYPKILLETGLAGALEALVDSFRSVSRVDVDAAIGPLPQCDRRRQMAVYRAVQESLTNAAKHGGGGFVWVSVQKSGDRIKGTVLNHVNPSSPPHAGKTSGGIGLELVTLRLQRIGGCLESGWAEKGVYKVDFVA